jgi:hypothetical protein
MWDDPIVAEVRAIRERLAAQFAFDVHSIFADVRKREAALGGRLVSRQRSGAAEHAPGPDRPSGALHPGR